MKKTTKTMLMILMSIALSASYSFAQETEEVNAATQTHEFQNYKEKYIVYVVPQSSFENALRIDIDRRLENGKTLTFGPRIFLAQDKEAYRELYGAGLEVAYKFVSLWIDPQQKAYFSIGGLYNIYNITFDQMDWEDHIENGVEVSVFESKPRTELINKFGPNILVGMELEVIPRLIVDFNIGLGARAGFNLKGDTQFQQEILNLASPVYTGILPLMAIKVGMSF